MDDTYWQGSNSICPFEAALMDAYVRLGRPDLAENVRRSKKFRRLNMLMEGEMPSIPDMRAIQRSFNDEPDPDPGEAVSTDDEWRAEVQEKYKGDHGLQLVLARHVAKAELLGP